MKKRFLPILAAVLLCLCACGSSGRTGRTPLSLWFVSDSGNLPELCRVEYHGGESIPELMQALLDGPPAAGTAVSPIPAGTALLDWEQRGTLAVVNLSREYGALADVKLTLADYCITLTLTQLDGVESVKITVNGGELSRREKQVFRREDVVLSGAEEEPVELIAALCFRQAGGNALGTEQRMFRLTESQSATLAVLRALLDGPTEAGLQALLPEQVQVYSARVEAGVCYADFSGELLDDIPDSEEEQILVIRSVVESLCSLGYVQAVQILVEGEPLARYGVLDVSQPLS